MDQIMEIKDYLLDTVKSQVSRNGANVNTQELGEVVDMIKDLAEAAYQCEKACETKMLMRGDIEPAQFYTEYRDMDKTYGRMYYPMTYAGNNGGRGGNGSSSRGGRGGMMGGGRRGYSEQPMDAKEIERYINELSDELIDMLRDIEPSEKAMFQQKITALANKIR